MNILSKEAQTYSPEVVDEQVEDAEDDDQKSGAELGLEADNDHDAGSSTKEADNDTPDGPFAAEDETDKEEDQENATSKLEVHLAILLIKLGQTSESLGLANPRVGKNHDETSNDGQVAEEEVEVENQAVTESLGYDNGNKTGNRIVGVLADDDESGTGNHGKNVSQQEEVGDARWDYKIVSNHARAAGTSASLWEALLCR